MVKVRDRTGNGGYSSTDGLEANRHGHLRALLARTKYPCAFQQVIAEARLLMRLAGLLFLKSFHESGQGFNRSQRQTVVD